MTLKELERLGHETRIVGPDENNPLTFAVPFYPEIKLEFFAHRRLGRILREFQPDFIHISTEGPLGWAARRVCLYRNLSFSTAYHTRFPEYLAARAPRVFAASCVSQHMRSCAAFMPRLARVIVATESIEQELRSRKFRSSRALVSRRRYELVSPIPRGVEPFDLAATYLFFVGTSRSRRTFARSFLISELSKPNRRRRRP